MNDLPDYRGNRASYEMSEIVLAAVFMFLFKEGSRNQLNEDREEDQFRKNYRLIFGLKLPHMDTVANVMKKMDPECLESIRRKIIRYLLDKRTLHRYRLLGIYFTVAIDGTGVYVYDSCPYEGCPSKTSKNGKTTWQQNVLEAKIVCSNGFSLSISTEWLKNGDGDIKQDCEQKALKRLLANLKSDYARLPICILLDGLFASAPVMEQIKAFQWEYIIVWKDGKLKKVQEQLVDFRLEKEIEKIHKEEIHNKKSKTIHLFEYSKAALHHKQHSFYYLKHQCEKKKLDKADAEDKKRFITICSIKPNKDNVIELTQAGRMRWKIENEGFNAQKNNGMGMQHKYVRNNFNGILNYYLCLQIAHIIEQLFLLSKNKIMAGWKTFKGLWKQLWATIFLVPLELLCPPCNNGKLNFRY